MRDGADVILVAMGDQQRAELDVVLFQGREAGHRDAVVTAGCGLQGQPAIDADPLSCGAVQVEIGTEHAGAAQGDEVGSGVAVQLVEARCRHDGFRSWACNTA